MRMSNLYMPTLREVPNDADIISAQLLLRAGMIRKLVSGVYSFLPLGFRVMKKVERIVREEMDRYGAQEVLMSAIQPREIWEESGRWENFGPEMFKLKDRHDREFCLGPTHEEYFTFMINNELKSYKQLPLNLYQIQTKYRDERRPRFGLVRAREFIMKDAYTFDVDQEGLEKSYDNMWRAYESAFDRLGFKYKVVQGDSGNMGGQVSHEFIAITPNGESTIAYCDHCDYAATDEVAASNFTQKVSEESIADMEKVLTVDIRTIEELENFFSMKGDRFIKTLLVKAEDDSRVFAVLIPGDRALSLIKLSKHVGVPEENLMMLTEDEIYGMTGSIMGFAGPFGLKESVEIIADSRVFNIKNGICGANIKDYHYKNVNLKEDDFSVSEDLILVEAGDACPSCGMPLAIDQGTEVGNIFQLGDKYSKSMNATFLDKDGKAKHFIMGSYGIGISRCVAAIVEQCFDDKGIIWPLSVAPYQVVVTIINTKVEAQVEAAEKIYDELLKKGIEVLIDDRNERAGVKFTDADLIGIPLRITVGKAIDQGLVEFSLRVDGEKKEMTINEAFEAIDNELSKIHR
ncbi:MAG: proline--tRNA ligase [Clostridiales bacterium]|nr:proline--tRNA ligase [Clostridiales bacterium]